MSGIFGFWNLDGRPADRDQLVGMSEALAHRGPDGWDGWCQGPLAIGHRMFRTTPESVHEQQPVVIAGGTRILSADLRLDNRDELIRRFGAPARPPDQTSDAELLGRAYQGYGGAVAQHLLGAFSFAIWDADRRELLCGRDHLGVKPLYYFHAPGRMFAFASEIKALLVLEGVPDEINDVEVARHLLVPLPDDVGSTYYKSIRRLPAAHLLSVTADGVTERQYWALDASRTLVLSSDEEYAEAVRETFVEAVRCRLRSRGPVASMLSGGLDSSSVSCVAARLLKEAGSTEALTTLSAIYPDVPESDERRYIDHVVNAYHTTPRFFEADRTSPIGDIDRFNRAGDGASLAGNLYLNWNLYRTAASSGGRVVLDGYDGDSTISHGQGVLNDLANGRRWWRLAIEAKALAEQIGQPWQAAVYSWLREYWIKPGLRAIRPRRVSNGTGANPRSEIGEWSIGLASRFRAELPVQIAPPQTGRLSHREQHHWLMTRSILFDLLNRAEAVGAAAGVEVRFPFFDLRLVELCMAIPGEQKLRHGVSRLVMRNAMRGILPEVVRLRRDKSNIAPGLQHALRTHAAEEIALAVEHSAEHLSPYVEPDHFAELHRGFVAGTISSAQEVRFWRIASLALWLKGVDGAHTAHNSDVRQHEVAAAS